jgi:hypothetical protein
MNGRLHKIPPSSFSTSAKLSEMMQSFARKISEETLSLTISSKLVYLIDDIIFSLS